MRSCSQRVVDLGGFAARNVIAASSAHAIESRIAPSTQSTVSDNSTPEGDWNAWPHTTRSDESTDLAIKQPLNSKWSVLDLVRGRPGHLLVMGAPSPMAEPGVAWRPVWHLVRRGPDIAEKNCGVTKCNYRFVRKVDIDMA